MKCCQTVAALQDDLRIDGFQPQIVLFEPVLFCVEFLRNGRLCAPL